MSSSDEDTHPAIAVERVSHTYTERFALRSLEFRVERGRLHALIGPNGAGKSTLLRLLSTLAELQVGRIDILGTPVSETFAVRRMTGIMPDRCGVYPRMTVTEYIDFFAAAYGMTGSDRDDRVQDVIAMTGLGAQANTEAQTLSRGFRQRVNLARAMIHDPQLLLLDEPAAGLDPRSRIELMDILRGLHAGGKTIVVSSHILSELADLCDSVTILDRGECPFSGSFADMRRIDVGRPAYRVVLAAPLSDFDQRAAEMAGIASVQPLPDVPGVKLELDNQHVDLGKATRVILGWGTPIVSIAPERRPLNQAFLELTRGGLD